MLGGRSIRGHRKLAACGDAVGAHIVIVVDALQSMKASRTLVNTGCELCAYVQTGEIFQNISKIFDTKFEKYFRKNYKIARSSKIAIVPCPADGRPCPFGAMRCPCPTSLVWDFISSCVAGLCLGSACCRPQLVARHVASSLGHRVRQARE